MQYNKVFITISGYRGTKQFDNEAGVVRHLRTKGFYFTYNGVKNCYFDLGHAGISRYGYGDGVKLYQLNRERAMIHIPSKVDSLIPVTGRLELNCDVFTGVANITHNGLFVTGGHRVNLNNTFRLKVEDTFSIYQEADIVKPFTKHDIVIHKGNEYLRASGNVKENFTMEKLQKHPEARMFIGRILRL